MGNGGLIGKEVYIMFKEAGYGFAWERDIDAFGQV